MDQKVGVMKTTVKLDGRHFIVKTDGDGKPLNIRERKLHAPGKPQEAFYEITYWHHSRGRFGWNTIVERVLREAGVPPNPL